MAFLEQAVNFVEEKVAVIVMTPVNFTQEAVAILVKKPEATLNEVILKSIRFDSFTLLAKVSVRNPCITTIPIVEINYILKSAESVMASGKISDPGLVMPMNLTLLVIEMKVPYSVVITLLQDARTEWAFDLHLCFTFDIPVIGDVTIPITGKGKIKLPAISKFLHCGKKEDKDWFSFKNWIREHLHGSLIISVYKILFPTGDGRII